MPQDALLDARRNVSERDRRAESAEVNLATEKASVEGVAGVLRPADLIAAVSGAGYGAGLLTGAVERERQIAAAEEQRLRQEKLEGDRRGFVERHCCCRCSA